MIGTWSTIQSSLRRNFFCNSENHSSPSLLLHHPLCNSRRNRLDVYITEGRPNVNVRKMQFLQFVVREEPKKAKPEREVHRTAGSDRSRILHEECSRNRKKWGQEGQDLAFQRGSMQILHLHGHTSSTTLCHSLYLLTTRLCLISWLESTKMAVQYTQGSVPLSWPYIRQVWHCLADSRTCYDPPGTFFLPLPKERRCVVLSQVVLVV